MRNIRISIILILLVFIPVSLVFGRANIPEPSETTNTLVIGAITQQGKGYQTYGSVSVNGTNKQGIEMTIQEIDSENTYTL